MEGNKDQSANKIENRKTIESINKKRLFVKLNKIDRPLARLTGEREGLQENIVKNCMPTCQITQRK